TGVAYQEHIIHRLNICATTIPDQTTSVEQNVYVQDDIVVRTNPNSYILQFTEQIPQRLSIFSYDGRELSSQEIRSNEITINQTMQKYSILILLHYQNEVKTLKLAPIMK